MIAVIDYQAGNLRSIQKALAFVGADHRIVDRPEGLGAVDRVLLPGVGNFGAAMDYLDRSGLTAAIRDWLKADRPFLGICLGMQMLFETSEEDPGRAGLGFFSGPCRQFRSGKIPQIGWNNVHPVKESGLLKGSAGDTYYYFLHSFYAVPDDRSIVSGITDYGLEYPSVVEQGRVCGVQFHPEKSGDQGIELMRKWAGDPVC
jgi:imidazole glycerol phosphate synthase glutamine amidotransferase subunit